MQPQNVLLRIEYLSPVTKEGKPSCSGDSTWKMTDNLQASTWGILSTQCETLMPRYVEVSVGKPQSAYVSASREQENRQTPSDQRGSRRILISVLLLLLLLYSYLVSPWYSTFDAHTLVQQKLLWYKWKTNLMRRAQATASFMKHPGKIERGLGKLCHSTC